MRESPTIPKGTRHRSLHRLSKAADANDTLKFYSCNLLRLPIALQRPRPITQGSLSGAQLDITSTPPGAEISIDGNFVGDTPSSNLNVAPGEHVVILKKSGYKTWERKLKVTGGEVKVLAELQK